MTSTKRNTLSLRHWLAPSRAGKGQELHSQVDCSMSGWGSQEVGL